MELKINAVTFPEKITFNYEEIKGAVAEKSKFYASLVYDEEQIKAAKSDRATLNKFVMALDDERKKMKKQCLAPYEDFEKQIKELIGIVNEPIAMIDGQIKGFEEQKKKEKLAAIRAYWDNATRSHTLPFEVDFEKIFNPKWLNATVAITTVCKEINDILKKVETELATLESLPEFAFEAVEIYKETLDLKEAIQEGQRLADIQRRKEFIIQQTAKYKEMLEPIDIEVPIRQWIGFRAFLTVEDAQALKLFFKERNITYKAL